MKNEEHAQAYREVADWLLEHGDIEPQVQVRLSKMVRDVESLREENEELKARCCRYAEEAMHWKAEAEGWAGTMASINEALNSGDGVYRP